MAEVFNGGVIVETLIPVSVPSGGAIGQSLVKKSNSSYDLEWKTIDGTGSGNGSGDMLMVVYDPDEDGVISYTDLGDRPLLGSAASLAAPSVGDAAVGEVVIGSDSRLADARAPLYHAHYIADIVGLQTALDNAGTVLNGTGFVKVNGTSVSYDNASYITGIDSAQVITALGFTPYGADNPDGYTSNAGTVTSTSVTSVNGFTGTVVNDTTTPAITIGTSVTGLLKGDGTGISAAVSGTDLKTINGVSILGSGNIVISAGEGGGGGTGSVTYVSVTTANGLAGTVLNESSTPAITLSTTVNGMVKGNGTSFSNAIAGTDYLLPTGSGSSLTGITVSQVSGAAPVASPSFTGTPLSVTAAVDTNTTQIATTAYVVGQGYLKSATAATTYATQASQGTAAAGVLTTSTTDTTTGRVVKVGDYGVGTAPVSSDNWNTVVASGRYRNTLTTATGVPEATVGLLMTNTYIDANTATQMAWNTASGAIYSRNKAAGAWAGWVTAISGAVGIARSITSTSASFTAGATTSTDYIYFITGAHTPTLPSAVGNTNKYTFRNNHTASVTIATTSSQTINGAATLGLPASTSVELISNGTNWFTV